LLQFFSFQSGSVRISAGAPHPAAHASIQNISGLLSFPKIRSGRIRAVRENQSIIKAGGPIQWKSYAFCPSPKRAMTRG
jgi:hypothetical protein